MHRTVRRIRPDRAHNDGQNGERRLFGALALVVLLGACGGAADDGADTDAPVTEPPPTSGPTDSEPAESEPTTSVPMASVPVTGDAEVAIADLAARQGVDPAAITVVSVENVTWRTGAIGCPQEGMQYIQVLTDGVRIVLEVDGRRFQYHAGGGRAPFYCPTPEPPVGE